MYYNVILTTYRITTSLTVTTFTRLNLEFHNLPKTKLTKTEDRILKRCFDLSGRSLHLKSQVASMIYEKNKIISMGVNSPKSHPFSAKCGTFKENIHAELKAIIDASKIDFTPEKGTIYIARRSKSLEPNPACSYPCRFCWGAIKEMSIRKIICYDVNGEPCKVDMKSV